ncbi:MAG: hypothetical protein D3905_04315 [Candidatus Electrothrix sp. AS4_5]|nr:hypothetical protein [Candidatus Electrothrix gigas]
MRLHYFRNALVSLTVTRILSIALLFTIILTGCVSNPTNSTVTEYKGAAQGEKVFHDIAQEIIQSKKRTVAIIDFPNKDGKKIEDGEHVAEYMAVSLKEIIGSNKKKVWIENGKSLMNALERHRIIKNGTITNKEQAKRFWQKKGIEAVITGILEPHHNEIGFLIELYDVQNNKVIHQFKGNLLRKDKYTTRGSQSSGSTKTSDDVYRPPIPSANEKISSHFLNSYEDATLEAVGEALEEALSNADFKHTAYLEVPEGFAIVSSPQELRFSFDGTRIPFKATIADNFRRLVKAFKEDPFFRTVKLYCSPKIPNVYQIVCVIVTSGRAYYKDQPEITFKKAQNLVIKGEATFLKELKNKKYNKEEHVCTVLLYAFEEDSSGKKIRFVSLNDPHNKIDIKELLQKTKFWRK